MARIEMCDFTADKGEAWNVCVKSSRIGTFLLCRDYMDYHSDRFQDASKVFYKKGKIVAVMPAASIGDEFISHPGLTYGGLVYGDSICGTEVLEMMEMLIKRLLDDGFNKMIYRAVPHIYHSRPSEEDLYALFRSDARLIARSLSSTIFLNDRIGMRRIRRCGIKKAEREGVSVEESRDYYQYWKLLSNTLMDRHGVSPVHSLEEISLLADRFPENIRLYVAKRKGEILAGTVVYDTGTVVHTQYIAASPEGRLCGALDLLMAYLIDESSNARYFDFGISCEKGGSELNDNLLYQKEGFGARGICYDTYEVDLKKLQRWGQIK